MNNQQIEDLLSGKTVVETIPVPESESLYLYLNNKFRSRLQKLSKGFKFSQYGKPSPTHFTIGYGHYKQIKFMLYFENDGYSFDHDESKKNITHATIQYEDGVHKGSAYGNPTPEVRRRTSVKHIAKLIAKIEEVYSLLEEATNQARKDEIQRRVEKLQLDKKDTLFELKDQLSSIRAFKRWHGSFSEQLGVELDLLLVAKKEEIKTEEARLAELPEFVNPKKVLNIV